MKFSIQVRQLCGFGFILIILVCVIGINMNSLYKIDQANKKLEAFNKNIEYSRNIQSAASEIIAIVDKIILKAKIGMDIEPLFGKYEAARILLDNNGKRLAALIGGEGGGGERELRDAWLDVRQNTRDFVTIMDGIITLAKKGKLEEAKRLEQQIAYRTEENFLVATELLLEQHKQTPLAGFDKVKKLNRNLQRNLFIISLLAIILGIGISIVISRSITKPIRDLHHGTEIIGNGNLDYKVGTKNQDEIGQLSRAFDQMTEKLKTTTVSGEFLRNIIESISHPLCIINTNDYTIEMANSVACPDGISDTSTCYALSHKSNKPCSGTEHICPLKKVGETKKAVTVTHIHYDKEGNKRDVEIHAYPLFDKEGNVKQIIEYALDITERKKAEKVIREAKEQLEEKKDELEKMNKDLLTEVTERKKVEKRINELNIRLQGIVKSSPLGVIVLDFDGKVAMWNPIAERIFGWTEKEIIGQLNPVVSVDKKDYFREAFSAAKEGKGTMFHNVSFCRKNGSAASVNISIASLRTTDGYIIGAVGIVEDVTKT